MGAGAGVGAVEGIVSRCAVRTAASVLTDERALASFVFAGAVDFASRDVVVELEPADFFEDKVGKRRGGGELDSLPVGVANVRGLGG